jgi:hypothetical protein
VDTSWLSVILGAGGVGFVGALFKGYKLLRDSAATREKRAIRGLEKWRLDADARTDEALAELDYERSLTAWWGRRAGVLEYALTSRGYPVPPLDEPKPPRPTPQQPTRKEGRAREE